MEKEQKARSTIENYSRDLNDFLSAFLDISFSELLEADESRIADYVDWLWKREAKQTAGQQRDRSRITYTSGPKQRRHSGPTPAPRLCSPLVSLHSQPQSPPTHLSPS